MFMGKLAQLVNSLLPNDVEATVHTEGTADTVYSVCSRTHKSNRPGIYFEINKTGKASVKAWKMSAPEHAWIFDAARDLPSFTQLNQDWPLYRGKLQQSMTSTHTIGSLVQDLYLDEPLEIL
jgi:hypothetical protein